MIPRIAALAWQNLLQVLRTPIEFITMLVLPLVFTFVAGQAFSYADAPVLVPFADGDGSPYSRQVGDLLGDEESFTVEAVSRERAEQLVADGDAVGAVIVDDGFAEAVEAGDARIAVLVDPSSDSAHALVAVVEGIAVRMSGNAAAAATVGATSGGATSFADTFRAADELWQPVAPVSVEGKTVIASEVRGQSVDASGVTQGSAGFAVYFTLFVIFGGAGGILEEREQKTLSRLLITPTTKPAILLGKVVGIVLTAVVQVLILTLGGALLFGVPWGDHLLANVILMLSFILAATGLAVLTSTVVRNRDQFSGLTPLLATGLAMVGGCFWPLDIVSPTMRAIAKFTPTGWAMTGLMDVLARNHGLAAVWLPAGVLVGMGALTLGLGAVLLKWE